jgi:hypothetical protein
MINFGRRLFNYFFTKKTDKNKKSAGPAVYNFIKTHNDFRVKIKTLITFINEIIESKNIETYFHINELRDIWPKVDMILAQQEPINIFEKITGDDRFKYSSGCMRTNKGYAVLNKNNLKNKDIHEDIPEDIDFHRDYFYLYYNFYATKSHPNIDNFSIKNMNKYNIIFIEISFNCDVKTADNYFKLLFEGPAALTEFQSVLRKLSLNGHTFHLTFEEIINADY